MFSKLTLKRYLEVCVMIVITFTIIIYLNNICRQMFVTGWGKRMGVVSKITERGWFNKSWEGELFVPSEEVSLNGSLQPDIWNFSVSDTNVVRQLRRLIGKTIIVKYNRSFDPLHRETLFDVIKIYTNNVPQVFIQINDEMLPFAKFRPGHVPPEKVDVPE